jgi:hypothetical protein
MVTAGPGGQGGPHTSHGCVQRDLGEELGVRKRVEDTRHQVCCSGSKGICCTITSVAESIFRTQRVRASLSGHYFALAYV